MATFLTLCQATARDSGTVPGSGAPASVDSQTGRLARIVGWVQESYDEIQRLHPNWRWMQDTFEGDTIAATREYAPEAFGIDERFGHWMSADDDDDTFCENDLSIYDPATGPDDEGFLSVVPYADFYRTFLHGSAATQTGKPHVATITPQDRIALHPLPDRVYRVRGRYQKGPQVLAANDDIPEMPAQFHDMIKWGALMLLGIFDETPNQMQSWAGKYTTLKARLEARQLPTIRRAGPLA